MIYYYVLTDHEDLPGVHVFSKWFHSYYYCKQSYKSQLNNSGIENNIDSEGNTHYKKFKALLNMDIFLIEFSLSLKVYWD